MTQNIKLLLFDLDGTIVNYPYGPYASSWEALMYGAGKLEENLSLGKVYIQLKGRYDEWVLKATKLLTGIPVKQVEPVIFPVKYNEGVKETILQLKTLYPKMKIGILSGGIDLVAERVKDELQLDFCVSNELEIVDGFFTGKIKCNVNLWEKHVALKRIAEMENVLLSQVCFVGDTEGDISCFQLCGFSIALKPRNDIVREAAKASTENFYEIPDILQKL